MLHAMSGFRALRYLVLGALLVFVAGGAVACGPDRRTGTENAATAAPRAHRPAPGDPDLSAVTERYYELVEGAHWPYAYAMLSPRYRATLSEAEFERRYAVLAGLDVHARQATASTVVTRIDAKDAADRTRARRYEETLTFVWDGEDWKIDRIARREITAPAAT